MDKVALCLCGCGQSAPICTINNSKKGYVKGQPMKFVRGHNRTRSLESCYRIDEVTGCWLWTCGMASVYGMLRGKGAHVLLYEDKHGPVPEGLLLDHKCRNKKCVNPDHTEPVTPAINVQRGPLAKLTAEKVIDIRERFAQGETIRSLSEEYQVTTSNVSCIVRNKSWKNIQPQPRKEY